MNSDLLRPGTDFHDIDRHFAAFAGNFGGDRRLVGAAAAALSRAVRDGHICLPLDRLSRTLGESDGVAEVESWPTTTEWRNKLSESVAVGGPADLTPLVIDSADRLYLRRYWDYQERLAEVVRDKCLRNGAVQQDGVATQEDAVAAALRNELTIICGGPGTGKTTTVASILVRLVAETDGRNLRIRLAAPTGKAAARLDEAIHSAVAKLGNGSNLSELMSHGATTIHRLLGRKGQFGSFRHDAENPLPLDLLVIDEASMVALPLLAKLFDALPRNCRVILLGDRDQLASVEPGAVLADLVDAAVSKGSPISSALITLHKNYRFGDDSRIYQACTAVRGGQTELVLEILRAGQTPDFQPTELSDPAELSRNLVACVIDGFAKLSTERDPAAALGQLNQFRVITPLREGPWGVAGLNRTITEALRAADLIPSPKTELFGGKPILILQNDYNLGLFNGDLGVILPDPNESGTHLYAWFIGKDKELRRFAHARLPDYETAYAMTVHKSQGSEFDRVLFVLPPVDRVLLTRELIYTGLTRARSVVKFWWNETVLLAAINRRAERNSGLGDLLREK